MFILALDLATQTGICSGRTDGNALPDLRSIVMPKTGPEIGPFLDFFDQYLCQILDAARPDLVVFEAPILPGQFASKPGKPAPMTNIATTRKLQGLASHLEFVCYRRKLAIEEVAASTAKAALGHGRFKKDDMMQAARRCGMRPGTYDEADAFGIWIAALNHHRPDHRAPWDARLSTGLL